MWINSHWGKIIKMVMKKKCDTLLKGIVISMDQERHVFLDGYVAVNKGIIESVGSISECKYESDNQLGGDGFIVLPGLVNVHSHLIQGCMRGMADGTTYEERLFGFYYPMTGACDEERSYIASMPPIMDLLLRGVTTTADDHFTHLHKRSIDGVLKAIDDSGIRCRMARLTINDKEAVPNGFREDLDEGLAETERVKSEWENDKISVTASTIGITYCEPDQLIELWKWTVDNDRQFDIHAPAVLDHKYLASRRGWEGGSFEWLDHVGILGPNVISAHSQNLRSGEEKLIADCGAAVALVPDMEQVLGLVNFDAKKFLESNVTCGLGLDGPVVAYGHDLWTAMRSFLTAQRMGDQHRTMMSDTQTKWTGDEVLYGSAEQALELATIDGAKALMMDENIGSLESGKFADILLIDRTSESHLTPMGSMIANLVYGNGPNQGAITAVMVQGNVVVENGKHKTIDHGEVVRKSDHLQEQLLDETDSRQYLRKRSRFTWVQ